MAPELVLALQGVALLWFLVRTTTTVLLSLAAALLHACWSSNSQDAKSYESTGCIFYEGSVWHERIRPVHNAFWYPVRMAVVDLDKPPAWWHEQAADHMTAAEARAFSGMDGPVSLLTTPISAGYSQNPISVYYCRDKVSGDVVVCIAEVTNTPWGARITFLFDPAGQSVPKAMHVSPFMDMASTWHLRAPLPGSTLRLSVSATHPQHGAFFTAVLTATRSASAARSEAAGLSRLWRYGFMPHRVAFWIYWQAVRLLWMGLPFYGYPPASLTAAAEAKAVHRASTNGRRFTWREPLQFPWNAS